MAARKKKSRCCCTRAYSRITGLRTIIIRKYHTKVNNNFSTLFSLCFYSSSPVFEMHRQARLSRSALPFILTLTGLRSAVLPPHGQTRIKAKRLFLWALGFGATPQNLQWFKMWKRTREKKTEKPLRCVRRIQKAVCGCAVGWVERKGFTLRPPTRTASVLFRWRARLGLAVSPTW